MSDSFQLLCQPAPKPLPPSDKRERAESDRRYRATHRQEKAKSDRAYRERHRGEIARRSAEYRKNHREERAQKSAKYLAEHRSERNERRRTAYAKNKEKMAEHRREYYLKHRERILSLLHRNPEKRSASLRAYNTSGKKSICDREYSRRHPGYYSMKAEKRRARLLKSKGAYSFAEWLALCNQWGNKCLHCGSTERLTRDHVIPLVMGGTNTLDNLQLLCLSCNSRKHTKSTDYRPAVFPIDLRRAAADSDGHCEPGSHRTGLPVVGMKED